MLKIYNGQTKQTRVRLNPIKKWSVAEEKALIVYLANNGRIEKPTAQTYYRRFCEQNKFNIPWKTVRSKVKNMRCSYYRAKAWEEGEEAANLTQKQIEIGVLRKCNNYHALDNIFGNQIIDFARKEYFGSENSNFPTSITIESDDASQKSDIDNLPTISRMSNTEIMHIKPDTSQRFDDDDNFLSACNKSEPELIEIKPDFIELKPQKLGQDFSLKCLEMGIEENELSFKQKINVMEIILKEKRLELREKQLISGEKIRMYEIESQERIKILELEMKERLAREELKMK